MRVCDICKTNDVSYDTYAVIDKDGTRRKLELCPKCYREFKERERQHEYLAYTETVQAMTGQIPRKAHWWNQISW